MEICFLNLGEIEVNLELHQKEKARSMRDRSEPRAPSKGKGKKHI
ncbi:hypothetical protein Gotur_032267 [Gossypium turneri]